MKAIFSIIMLSSLAFSSISCSSNQIVKYTDDYKSLNMDAIYNNGIRYFKQNKYLEALGHFYVVSNYKKDDLTVQCYVGLCISFIEESNREKTKLDKYLNKSKNFDHQLLYSIGKVYGHIFKEYERALEILDIAINFSKSMNCWDYIEKGYMYLYLNKKDDAIKMFEIANRVAIDTNDAAGMETAPQLIEQIDEQLANFQEKT